MDTERPDHRTARLRNATLLFVAAAIIMFATLPSAWGAPLAGGSLIIAMFLGRHWLLTGQSRTRFESPDILAEHVGPDYFERTGLHFAPRLTVTSGLCWFEVFCQNRYAKPCTGTMYFIPMEGGATAGPLEVLPIAADFELDGGEVGVIRYPYPIARTWQGKIMVYDVMAQVRYPDGDGELLRTPRGREVNEPTNELRENLLTAGLLAAGFVRIPASRGASCELRLPENVAERLPPDAAIIVMSLWQWQQPTGGFPVESKVADGRDAG